MAPQLEELDAGTMQGRWSMEIEWREHDLRVPTHLRTQWRRTPVLLGNALDADLGALKSLTLRDFHLEPESLVSALCGRDTGGIG